MLLFRFHPVSRLLLAVLALTLFLCSAAFHSAWGQQPAKGADAKKELADEKNIRMLIEQLGDDSFEKREAATARLTAIGEPAMGLLEKAAKDGADFETRTRAGDVIQAIIRGMFAQVRQMAGKHDGPAMPFVSRVGVTPDGRRAISVGRDALRGWDVQTGKQVIEFEERKGLGAWGFALSADGSKVIMGSHDKNILIFDVATGKKLQTLGTHAAPIWGVAFTPDGKQAISGGDEKIIRVWDVASGKEARRFETGAQQIRNLALSPDGKLVAVGHFGGVNQPATVRIWDFEKGVVLRALEGHKKEVASVNFSPDGKTLSSTSFDSTIRLWDVATGKEIQRLVGHTARVEYAAFTPDGKRIVSCGDRQDPSLKLWDIATGKMLLEAPRVQEGYHCVVILPDGRHCVTAGRDGAVRLWE